MLFIIYYKREQRSRKLSLDINCCGVDFHVLINISSPLSVIAKKRPLYLESEMDCCLSQAGISRARRFFFRFVPLFQSLFYSTDHLIRCIGCEASLLISRQGGKQGNRRILEHCDDKRKEIKKRERIGK